MLLFLNHYLKGPIDIQFNSILFEELLHKGTFKVVHHGIVNQPINGMLSVPVAVKRLKGTCYKIREELMTIIINISR